MNRIVTIFVAGTAMALATASPAQVKAPGHWAWIADPVIGPKSSMPTHHHVWIPDDPNVAAGKGPGHWQWLTQVSVGPRAAGPVHRRVWVSAQ